MNKLAPCPPKQIQQHTFNQFVVFGQTWDILQGTKVSCDLDNGLEKMIKIAIYVQRKWVDLCIKFQRVEKDRFLIRCYLALRKASSKSLGFDSFPIIYDSMIPWKDFSKYMYAGW